MEDPTKSILLFCKVPQIRKVHYIGQEIAFQLFQDSKALLRALALGRALKSLKSLKTIITLCLRVGRMILTTLKE